MAVAHIQMQTGRSLKPFEIQEHILDVGDRMQLPLKPFVEFPEIVKELWGTIFLGNDKGRRSPL